MGRIDRVPRFKAPHAPERTFFPGVPVHYVLGLVFAFLYLVGFRAFGFPFNPFTGAFVGAFHGGLAMAVVETIVYRRHPRRQNPHAEDNEARFAAFVQYIFQFLYSTAAGCCLVVLDDACPFAGRRRLCSCESLPALDERRLGESTRPGRGDYRSAERCRTCRISGTA